MHPLESYLRSLSDIHSSGAAVPETSYYGPLANLLDEVGQELRPRVRCIVHPQDRGAGIPDGGFFSAEQFEKATALAPLPGQLPARGALEVKSPAEEVDQVSRGEQVARYLETYGQVLVTNLRDFLLVERGAAGRPRLLERYSLAESEATFWSAAVHPRRMAEQHGGRLADYLRRALTHGVPIAAPADLAWLLASYAREARARVEAAHLPALASVRAAMEEALGIHFEGDRGEHFFRSTLVQTLFYGLFSAWVLWHNEHPRTGDSFDWRSAEHYLRVPVIQALFEQLALPSKLKPLHLLEVMDWANEALARVDRDAFFERFEQDQAVQYFYEPFLEAYDPELRKDLGVWYTPTEVVRYMVARVDTVLREELGLPDGLADERVVVLDPCCGTGAYLVEVLRRIAATLREKGEGALLGATLKKAALQRVLGFEILPAPFVIAHLQLGLLLHEHGAELSAAVEVNLDGGVVERAGVYLTNALTGWGRPAGDGEEARPQRGLFPELEEEHDAAERVKRGRRILVVLGNPPYNSFAGLAMGEERDLVEAYRTTVRAPAPQGQGLNDLYVRFFRMAERCIVEGAGRGVVCFISNYSWLDGLSYTGMRERYLEAFDRVWVDCLNGDKYKTGKLTPEGEPDPSVFSTAANPEGIQVGTAVALLVRRGDGAGVGGVQFRHWWGRMKRARLLEALEQPEANPYQAVMPALPLGLPFMPATVRADYLCWPRLPELFPVSFPGIQPSRDDVVVDIDRSRLEWRMKQYFDPQVSDEEMRRISPRAMETTTWFDAEGTRDYLRKRGYLPQNVVRYQYRPFDLRWLYWEPETKLLDRNRAEYYAQVREGNDWLGAAQRNRKDFDPPIVSARPCSRHVIERGANMFPLYLYPSTEQRTLFAGEGSGPQPNLSDAAAVYLAKLSATAGDLFYHALAVLHAPAYRRENAGALRQDWPRVPLPESREALLVSAGLGRQVAALLDSESPVPGVTAGTLRAELRGLAVPARMGGGSLAGEDFSLSAGWGHAGKGGVTMPGQGWLTAREYSPAEWDAVEQGAAALGLSAEQARAVLGADTLDVYLNDAACWQNVPRRVWEYTIGGYQVIKKWLSYRERALLGRPLSADEVREVRDMARRIAALLLLGPALDASYAACAS